MSGKERFFLHWFAISNASVVGLLFSLNPFVAKIYVSLMVVFGFFYTRRLIRLVYESVKDKNV